MSSDPKAAPRRRYLPLLALSLAGVAAVLAWLYWPGGAEVASGQGGPGGGGKERPVPVVAQPVRSGDLQVYLSGTGTVTPRNTVTIRTRVDGQLMRIAFEEGQYVQAGDLLAEIDPRPSQMQLLLAQGALARDQALLENARVDLERYRTLYQQDSGSKQQWDTQKSLVGQYEGAIKSDQSQIDSAKLQLTYCRITAPFSGRLGLRQVDAGNVVHATDPAGLVVINQMQPILAVFTLPEDNLSAILRQVRAGERPPVDVYDRNQTTKLASGELVTLDNQIDPTTGTIRLKAEFANEDGALFPNQFVNVRLLIDSLHDATLVPTAAVQRGVQGTFVYVVGADQRVSVRPVKLGPTEGELAAVADGLKPGELVVVDGTDKLREGAKVELGSRDGPAAGQAKGPASGPAADAPPGQAAAPERRHRRSAP
ncbi:MdtA/MuxA family multidrug efflux RND transporter periplasmic adaptor subunit [uncultured Thiodictyon sp.]|uniref:MdtA/MuxA family multidrug efflux RND transporter periplasmic adaptor subunit n=1 Tax=uncultured Thiodictyon sp. TaxID=1846217 RepID=UPI0025D1C643|nr:MdtA/MuxA family multidrug efflux RND transporter periplasmic adaptor subunit [uncultured Thiodictyon sp.]